jgi:peptide/nickel transport system permease protein
MSPARRFLGQWPAVAALAVLLFVAVLVFTSQGISLWGWINIPGWWQLPYDQPLPLVNGGHPTWTLPFTFGAHPFGQDRIGRDMFAMTMRGAQLSLMVMVTIGLIGTAIGVAVGAAAGYFRGWPEAVLMRFTDIVIIIPAVVLAAVVGRIATTAPFAPVQKTFGVVLLGVFLGLVVWTGLARLVRGEVLSLRERDFVAASRLAGASHWHIVTKHLVPNVLGTVIVNATLLMSSAILLEAGLSYLGFGVSAPDTSLGLLISANQDSFTTRPWLFWWPGAFIVVICLCINFIGDGLRHAFDPRQEA